MAELTLIEQTYQWLGGGPGAASVVVAMVALVGAAAGAVVSYVIAGRTVYINSITAERSKWIDKLRTNISAYSANIAHTKLRLSQQTQFPETNPQLIVDKLEEANNLAAMVQLQLNPRGAIDRNILRLIASIVIRKGGSIELLQTADDLLIAHSQWLLKAEWEKVKFEARSPLYRLWHCCDEGKRLNEYRKWAAAEGAIDAVVEQFSAEKLRA